MKRRSLEDELRYRYQRYGHAEVIEHDGGFAIEIVNRMKGNSFEYGLLHHPMIGKPKVWQVRNDALEALALCLHDL